MLSIRLWRHQPDSTWLFFGHCSKLNFVFLNWRIVPVEQTISFFPWFFNWRERSADTEPGAPPPPLRVTCWRCWRPGEPLWGGGGWPGRGWVWGREGRAVRGGGGEDWVLTWAPLNHDAGRASLNWLGPVTALRGRRPRPPHPAGPKSRALGKSSLMKRKVKTFTLDLGIWDLSSRLTFWKLDRLEKEKSLVREHLRELVLSEETAETPVNAK